MNKLPRRIIMSLGGVLICAVSIAIFKTAALGVDPFQTFMSGLDALLPLSFGTLYAGMNLFLLIFIFLLDRHNIGISTFINLFLLGYVVDFSMEILAALLGAPSLPVRFVCLAVGVVTLSVGVAFCMTADLGISAYDAVAVVLSERLKLARFKLCRVVVDILSVVIGAVLFLVAGGRLSALPTIVGIGTVITAFFMGPLIDFFNRRLARPLLGE